jgi:hypothetical protein
MTYDLTDRDYLQRRERDERVLALRSTDPTVSGAHRRMADAYAARLSEFPSLTIEASDYGR